MGVHEERATEETPHSLVFKNYAFYRLDREGGLIRRCCICLSDFDHKNPEEKSKDTWKHHNIVGFHCADCEDDDKFDVCGTCVEKNIFGFDFAKDNDIIRYEALSEDLEPRFAFDFKVDAEKWRQEEVHHSTGAEADKKKKKKEPA